MLSTVVSSNEQVSGRKNKQIFHRNLFNPYYSIHFSALPPTSVCVSLLVAFSPPLPLLRTWINMSRSDVHTEFTEMKLALTFSSNSWHGSKQVYSLKCQNSFNAGFWWFGWCSTVHILTLLFTFKLVSVIDQCYLSIVLIIFTHSPHTVANTLAIGKLFLQVGMWWQMVSFVFHQHVLYILFWSRHSNINVHQYAVKNTHMLCIFICLWSTYIRSLCLPHVQYIIKQWVYSGKINP